MGSKKVESGLPLAVGDQVVYASHGLGRVTKRATDQSGQEVVVIEFATGLQVTFRLDKAQDSLRALSTEKELKEVRRALADTAPAATGAWAARFRATKEKVTAGGAVGLAEVVRESIQRERQAAAKRGGSAAPSERHLYVLARRLLAEEISSVRGIDVAAADAWIAAQVPDVAD